MIQRAMTNTLQLIIPGVIISVVVAIGLGVYSAVKQYSPGDYLFTTLAFIGIALPPFWFGLHGHPVPRGAVQEHVFSLAQTPFYFVGLHSGDGSGFNADYAPPPGPADPHPDRADHRRLEPLPAGVHARRACRPTTCAPPRPRACPGAG